MIGDVVLILQTTTGEFFDTPSQETQKNDGVVGATGATLEPRKQVVIKLRLNNQISEKLFKEIIYSLSNNFT